ncbi:anion transporter [Ideonella sp. DXS22W]|uniref:Anion transporter n=1 Tax=Pseudaquabacterium inlustre TaxID=2984192 RepID=A0ABU9CJR3_9BURK
MSSAGTWEAVAIFATVYLGMVLGGLPRLRLDRTGVALLGAIAVVGLGLMTPEAAAQAIHLPTIVLLFSFMVISAQMRLGGFYGAVTRAIVALPLSPAALMGVVVGVSAALSAVFSNDIVCLAVAPVLARACRQRALDAVPYLLGLACAANIGSAATLIGNPQNMLIGEVLKLPFGAYLREALPPVLAGLLALWALLAWPLRGAGLQPRIQTDAARRPADSDDEPPLDRWQTAKGLAVAGALVLVFLWGGWPRDVAALVGAGVLLLSQRFHSSRVMSLVDWELLVLFMGLFVVNAAFAQTGLARQAVAALAGQGIDLNQPLPLMGATLVLSNLVSNVPAVMLLLPVAHGAHVGPTLALISTLAGNLLIVGSIANIIVVDAARREGIAIDWRRHARTGVPVTLLTLGLAAGWLLWRAG